MVDVRFDTNAEDSGIFYGESPALNKYANWKADDHVVLCILSGRDENMEWHEIDRYQKDREKS